MREVLHHIGRLTRLRDADHQRAVQVQVRTVHRDDRRRRQPTRDAVLNLEQVLEVGGGVVGGAPRRKEHRLNRVVAYLLRDGLNRAPFLVGDAPQHFGLLANLRSHQVRHRGYCTCAGYGRATIVSSESPQRCG
jgi:hypothetical protein